MRKMSNLFSGGYFALGIFSGLMAALSMHFFASTCAQEDRILWFCNESEEVVIASIQAIGSTTASLAWPVLALIIVLIFKPKVEALLEKITHVKMPGVEAIFRGYVEGAETLIPKNEGEPHARHVISEKVMQYLKVDMRFAVISAWIDIESKLQALAEKRGIGESTSGRINFFSDAILKQLNLTNGLTAAIRDVRHARNLVAHAASSDMTEESVIRYLEIANEITILLDKMLSNKTSKE